MLIFYFLNEVKNTLSLSKDKNSRETSEKLSGDFGKTLGRFQENSRENLEKLSGEFLSPSNPFAERGKERPFYD